MESRDRLQAKIDSYYQGNIEPTPKIDIPKPKGDLPNVGAPAPKPSGRMRWDAKKNKMIPY